MTSDMQPFNGFSSEALAALETPGVAARWAAVQERLHPALAALAARIESAALKHMPREWPLYEISFKDARHINRAAAGRAPIDEYHLAIDRPPRGAGVYVVISGAERRVIVAIQLWGLRKPELRRAWEEGRRVWEPLIGRFGDIRFSERGARARSADQNSGALQTAPLDTPAAPTWLDRYLRSRTASYLLAGFSYPWDAPLVGRAEFAERVIEDVLALLPLNEAIMEQAEQGAPAGAALLRERRADYLALPSADEIVARVRARGLALPDDLVRAYHLALQTRPLVILPGISGTGKTRLTRLYADAVYGVREGQENEHYLIVAVQPDWHNARDLLGYYNALTGKFHATPFLRFLVRAAGEPGSPHFVCLDEMNLARPEYYLAPILSALETDDRLIDLGVPGPSAEAVSGEVLTNPFRLPLNLALTGTVNVDESTHPISDKLLDRANVIELVDVDLAAFRATYRGPVDEDAWQAIAAVHAALARAGQPFGYRTLAEMLRYLERARGVLTPARALDQQIKQKVLPKLRGEETPRLRRALTELFELALGGPLREWGRAAQVPPEAIAAAPLPDTAEKLRRMLERLDADGFTDFYG